MSSENCGQATQTLVLSNGSDDDDRHQDVAAHYARNNLNRVKDTTGEFGINNGINSYNQHSP